MSKEKLNILEVIFSPAWGGLEMLACTLSINFKNLGHDVIVVAPPNSKIIEQCKSFGLKTVEMRPAVKYLDLFTALRLRKLIKKHKIGVIHGHISKDLSTLALAKKFTGKVKVVFSQHMDSRYPKKDIFHKWVFKKIDLVIAVTRSVAEHTLEFSAATINQVKYIYNGVDLDRFEPMTNFDIIEELEIPRGSRVVGIVGRLDRLKKQELLIEAADDVLAKFPDTHFIIVGEETPSKTGVGYKAELQAMIKNKDLEDKFRLVGFRENVQEISCMFDVSVLTTPKETFGLVLIEAMAMGIPVVGTNAGGVPEIIDHGVDGMLYEPDNAKELAECLVDLLEDKKKRDRMGKKGIKKAWEKFDLQKNIKEYERLFRELNIKEVY